MFDKFGEFDSAGELNEAAAGQLAQGDLTALYELCLLYTSPSPRDTR